MRLSLFISTSALLVMMILVVPSVLAQQQCQRCHQDQVQDWQESHHFRAMNSATREFIAADFANQRIAFEDQVLIPSREGHDFVLRYEYSDGSSASKKIYYTFGFHPLQQYLVRGERGDYQFIPLAWDNRDKEQGGQRWFVLHPEQRKIDEFHHTQMGQNWNHMCADCHSTGFQKAFNPESNRFNSSYSAINVSCAACHGDSKQHLVWAGGDKGLKNKGFDRDITIQVALFTQDADSNMIPIGEQTSSQQIEVCATCHSRRSQLAERDPDKSFYDLFRPALLSPELYHVDGQIFDENYVWGSFLQSKMFTAGVTCSNCHNPHSGKLKFSGNQTCTQCHTQSEFDTPIHHGHKNDTVGSKCVDCHMPATTYMQVDPRRDHSLRVPRPDLTIKTQAPNACNSCHEDKSPQWAVNAIKSWHPDSATMTDEHFSLAFHAADRRLPNASQLLTRIAQSSQYNDIIRASALVRMAGYPDQNTFVAISRAVRDDEQLKRLGAITAAQGFLLAQRYTLLRPLLEDPRLSIRSEAARSIAAMLNVPFPDNLKGKERATLESALEEYRQTELFNAERGSSHTNLGNLALALGQPKQAREHYMSAIEVEPVYMPAYVNLADNHRRSGAEPKAREVLQQALKVEPTSAAVHYALAMSWVRSKDRQQAKHHLQIAAEYGSADHIYTYGLLLNEMGEVNEAIVQLEKAFALNTNNADLCYILTKLYLSQKNYSQALLSATRLQQLVPGDRKVQMLVEQLTMMQGISP